MIKPMKYMQSLTAKFYAFSFFDDFILIYPLYAVMFADARLSPSKITSLFVIWSLTSFLLEVPTGVLADKYPRKNILIIGILIRALGFSSWLLWRNYLGFMLGFILWGIKSALTSGTKEALVYDELNRIGKVSDYAKVTSRMGSLELTGVVLAAFGASTLATRGYSLILVFSIVAVVISAVAIYLLPKALAVEPSEETKYFDHLREGVKVVFSKPIIPFLVLFMGVVAGIGAIDEYFGLFFREKGLSNSSIAFWTGFIFLLGALGNIFIYKLENKKLRLEYSLFLWAVILFAAALVPGLWAPLILGIYMMFFFGAHTLFNIFLQKELDDKTRATATSVGGFASEIFGLLGYAVISFGASRGGYTYGFKLVAVAVVISAILLFSYARKSKLDV